MYKLREYQKNAVKVGLELFESDKNKTGIIVSPTGSGKSLIIASIGKELKGDTIVLQPTLEILKQNLSKMKEFGLNDIGVFSASAKRKDFGKITFATIGSIYNKKDEWDRFQNIIIDECFTGETEILTNEGFKRFDSLDKTEKIAQWDNNKISFVKPIRFIEKKHNGDMILFNVKNNVIVPMTPLHNQVLINKENGQINNTPISKCCFSNKWLLPVSGFSTEKSDELSPLERMYIATQADGSIHKIYNKYTTISFSFNKERKIRRIKKLIKESGLESSIVKHPKHNAIRIMVKMPVGTTKDINNHIHYPMSAKKASQIIEEMVEWNGHRIRGGRQYYFSFNDKFQSDFYNQVAVLAGHRCYQSIEIDNRKETYSTMHRLYITLDKQKEDTQKCNISMSSYVGKVYCVEVDSHTIIVRHNGFTFVTGNCHLVNSKKGMYSEFIDAHNGSVLGITATPFRLHSYQDIRTEQKYVVAKMLTRTKPRIFKEIIHITQVQKLYEQKYLCPVKYIINKNYKHSDIELNSTGMDFNQDRLKEYNEKQNIVKIISDLVKEQKAKHILVFNVFVAEAEALSENLKKLNIKSESISANTSSDERERIISDFKSGKIKVVTNVGVLTLGFDFPELDCVILARPTQSVVLFSQMIGRSIRISKDKEYTTVIDMCGNVERFGKVETFQFVAHKGDKKKIRLRSNTGYLTGYDFVGNNDLEESDYSGLLKGSSFGVDIIHFGKYKGTHIKEVPLQYLEWCVEIFSDGKYKKQFQKELNHRLTKK